MSGWWLRLLGLRADRVDEGQRGGEVGQLVRRGDRRLVGLGSLPVGQVRQPGGHLGVGQQLLIGPANGPASAACQGSRGTAWVACPRAARAVGAASVGDEGIEHEGMARAAARSKPWVAHLLRAVERFTNRLGNQFGAAITYFSVLALVPILLFAFAVLGFVLTVLRPDLIDDVVGLCLRGARRTRRRDPAAARSR